MVSHWRLHPNRSWDFSGSHLFCAGAPRVQQQTAVKLHGVFPSCRGLGASSPPLHFHRAPPRDSAALVEPFMQAGTYPARDYATLGPSELRPPFTRAWAQSFAGFPRLTLHLHLRAPGRLQSLYVPFRVGRDLCF